MEAEGETERIYTVRTDDPKAKYRDGQRIIVAMGRMPGHGETALVEFRPRDGRKPVLQLKTVAIVGGREFLLPIGRTSPKTEKDDEWIVLGVVAFKMVPDKG